MVAATAVKKVPTDEECEAFISRFDSDHKAWSEFFSNVSALNAEKRELAFEAVRLAASEHGVLLDDSDTAKAFMKEIAGVDFDTGSAPNTSKLSFHLVRRLRESCPSGFKNEAGQIWNLKTKIPDWFMSEIQNSMTESGRILEQDLRALSEDFGAGPFVERDQRPSEIKKKKQSSGT
jgi:hypothetical protein